MAQNLNDDDDKEIWLLDSGDSSCYVSPSSNFYLSDDGDEESLDFSDDDNDEEKVRILECQVEQTKAQNQLKASTIEALRDEIGASGEPEKEIASAPTSEYQWSCFLHEWRRAFGEWGKRVLDVAQCDNDDRKRAGHLLIEIYRRRQMLANCKAYILKDLASDGQNTSDGENLA